MKRLSFLFLSLVPLLLLSPVSFKPDTTATVTFWSDDFDSYFPGTSLHGLGGWKGWANDPTVTAYTTSAIFWNSPNSVDISDRSDLVHEFHVNSGLVHFRFFQYIPAHLSGTSYFIMLNQYDDNGSSNNWSVQVRFQSNTGLMIDDGTGNTMPYIPDQWVEVCLEIDLDSDTQTFLYDGLLFYTGSWSDHISGGGVTSVGAVSLFANDASSIYYDDMSLGTGYCAAIYLPTILRS